MDFVATWIENCMGLIEIIPAICNIIIPTISTALSGGARIINVIIQPAVNQLNDLAVQARNMAGKE